MRYIIGLEVTEVAAESITTIADRSEQAPVVHSRTQDLDKRYGRR
jgi:hypothetical protein